MFKKFLFVAVAAAAAATSLAVVGASQPAEAVAAPARISVMQVNICLTGNNTSCFDQSSSTKSASAKRTKLVSLANAEKPDVIVVNEGCQRDMEKVRDELSGYYLYTRQSKVEGKECTLSKEGNSRGETVEAIFSLERANKKAEGLITGRLGWGCATVKGNAVVCTTHLNTVGDVGQTKQNTQCSEIKAVMAAQRGSAKQPTIFSGDLNRKDDACLPDSGWKGFQDSPGPSQNSAGILGLQHTYFSYEFAAPTCPTTEYLPQSDHPAMFTDLVSRATGATDRGSCEKWVHK